MKKERKPVAMNIRNLDPDLRRRFKLWCAEKGTTMQAAVAQMLCTIVEKGGRERDESHPSPKK